ncbi:MULTISPECIES: flagellar hook-length control protein FliK [Solibacillus]|uniref:Flagellar hook-length control protein FliK n=1 Tax=Solibacillus merdavium TaxID=2762218 RepID=A0ABR8XII9_9BACL|nr:flagellar hook-length control protein FliK [Solibacillus merdavium]MBD8031755.1 flagellar hook-length control protein FliK [Solibacillus merdavium]
MNIGMLQTKMPKQISNSNTVQSSVPDAKAFGSVFQSIVSSTKQTVQQIESTEDSLANSVIGILENDSLPSLLQQLGIEMDESELFAFIGEEGTPIAVDEMLSLENIAELVGMTEEQLTRIIDQLLGNTNHESKDIWSIIEQAPQILSEILATIQGLQQNDSLNVQPKELQQVVQFLKLTQLLGNKVDTVYQQEVQLAQLKEALLALANEARKTVDLEQNTTKTTNFQQIVQQVTQQSAQQNSQNQSQQNQPAQQTTVKIESDTQPAIQLQQQATQIKNVTITLPAEKPAQSEALLKEIQNLINRSQLSGQQGNMKLFLKLFPENLGQIRIELVQKDGVLTARLLATTAIGKELLENNMNQLKAGFVAQNIQMDRIDVAQSLQDADRNTRDQSFLNNFFGKQKEEDEVEEKEDNQEEEVISFKDLLSEEV